MPAQPALLGTMVPPASSSAPVRTTARVSPPRGPATVVLASMVELVSTVSGAVPLPWTRYPGWSWF